LGRTPRHHPVITFDNGGVDALERDAVGPEGQHGVLIDNVMVLRRR
jgi:hypothetical protein